MGKIWARKDRLGMDREGGSLVGKDPGTNLMKILSKTLNCPQTQASGRSFFDDCLLFWLTTMSRIFKYSVFIIVPWNVHLLLIYVLQTNEIL